VALARTTLIVSGLAPVAVALGALALGDYALLLLTYVGLSAIVALGLVLLTGQAGLPSFAQAGFVGIGAYSSALLSVRLGVPPWLTWPLALAVVGVCAWGGAQVMVRLSGHYLSLATIAFATALYFVFGGLTITGGQSGLSGIPELFAGVEANYLFVWVALLLLLLLCANLLDSRIGRAIRAIKDEALMAEAMGVNTPALKTAVFVIACLMAGFVGWFYAYFQRFVNPSPFSLSQGIEYLFMAVLGGASMLWGAVLGAAVVTLLKPLLRTQVAGLLGVPGNFEGVVFGAVVILLFQFASDGLLPQLKRALGRAAMSPRPIKASMPLPPLPLSAAAAGPALAVRAACKAFGGLAANDDITLSVFRGEIVALIGPNGAGKSTLFDLLTGITRADRGDFLLDGVSIAGRSPREIARRGVRRSFQHVRLIPQMSVIENVAIGAHARGRAGLLAAMLRMDRAEEAAIFAEAMGQLVRVGLADRAWMEAGSLALGQQRIVEIARALAGAPSLLLLDEPAAGLRAAEKQNLAGFVGGLRAAGMAILLVEHDMDFVMRLADRVVVLEFGRVIAAGTPAEVQRDPHVREAYLGTVA
jgi:branched-chain amino acid transport system permease protein